jgi:hypothetical protein
MANIMEKSSLDEIRIRDLECGTVFKFNDKWYIKSINHRGFREFSTRISCSRLDKSIKVR